MTLSVQHFVRGRSAHRARRRAFTLVEVLIVVMIMAIMAAVVVPQVGFAIDEARETAMLGNLQGLTLAIERFKINHNGRPPDDLTGNTLSQLVNSTNEFGEIGEGPEYPYGPYLLEGIHVNPLNSSAKVFGTNQTPPKNLDRIIGWVYNPDTGEIWGGLRRGSFPDAT